MNKQLINKYKHEFDHWLNEGSVLINSDLGWCPIATEFTWSCNISVDTVFVINDEYSEFRKALAKGKIIQIYDVIEQHISNPSLDKFGWKDFKSFTASSSFSKTPDLYRIKPDEPKFKVGDFVIHNGDIKQVTKAINGLIDCLDNSVALIYKEDTLEPWTPVKGEWCWFYDSKTNKYSHLSQFNSINNGYFKSMSINYYNFCEPFLNSLPSYLKDK